MFSILSQTEATLTLQACAVAADPTCLCFNPWNSVNRVHISDLLLVLFIYITAPYGLDPHCCKPSCYHQCLYLQNKSKCKYWNYSLSLNVLKLSYMNDLFLSSVAALLKKDPCKKLLSYSWRTYCNLWFCPSFLFFFFFFFFLRSTTGDMIGLLTIVKITWDRSYYRSFS